MCEELDEEVREGRNYAESLAWHLRAMGAGRAEFPVEVEGGQYRVVVEMVGAEGTANG
jgi:hypothetical protein